MKSIYPFRIEFTGGPQDGLYLDTPYFSGERMWTQATPISNGVADRGVRNRALYVLKRSAYEREGHLPRIIFGYCFEGLEDQGASRVKEHMQATDPPRTGPVRRWIAKQWARLTRWLFAPVNYPLSTRGMSPWQCAYESQYDSRR